MNETIRVTVWNEGVHEKTHDEVKAVYPNGIHNVLADGLRKHSFQVSTATLDDEPDHGLTDEVLACTDVMTWWGHMAHDRVKDEVARKVRARVLEGMGLICLHSAHMSKVFRGLMGTGCMLKWREVAEKERLWVVNPAHPIAADLPEYIELPHTEMYGEHFDIPAPDDLVFISWFAGGEVFRSGCCWHRGRGKVFYFRPGHETYPIYYNDQIIQVIANAVRWAAPVNTAVPVRGNYMPPLEDIGSQAKA